MPGTPTRALIARCLRFLPLIALLAVVVAPSAHAIDKCKVKIDSKTGVIQVDASGVGGPLAWGSASGEEDQTFFNDLTCNLNGKAKKCQLADPATVESKTPPAGCTIYLDDGVASCSAWIRGCTPGARTEVDVTALEADIAALEGLHCVPDASASPRYVDNGDGTVTDYTTCLMWEQKTDDGTVHDKDNLYNWSTGSPYNPDGGAFFDFLAELNGPSPFAGHDDWRLPTITELESIVDLTQPGAPYIDQTVFGPTQSSLYWSSATDQNSPVNAWLVFFLNGLTGADVKTRGAYVRAVRAGS